MPSGELAIPSDIFDQELAKLGVSSKLTLDLAGLTRVYAAYSLHVPNDNIQKRIWLVGDRAKPLTGGDPIEFFVNWLEHGTGGTCFPTNGALCAMLCAIGFDARRLSGAVLMEGLEHDGNHGTVIVKIDGINYLVDAQLASFVPPLDHRSTCVNRQRHPRHKRRAECRRIRRTLVSWCQP
jgi:arylamine N-acetyltransferase